MFGGHVSAQDGNSDLEHPSIITPIVLLMEISKDGSDSDGGSFTTDPSGEPKCTTNCLGLRIR